MAEKFACNQELRRVRLAMLAEQAFEPGSMDFVGMAFHPHQPLGQFVEPRAIRADVAEQRQRLGRQPGGIDDDAPDVAHFGFEFGDVVQVDRARGLLHLVDRVVHRCDQVGDRAAVERGQESAADGLQHFAGNRVGIMPVSYTHLDVYKRQGYRIEGQRMNLNLGLEAITETFVSGRPDDPTPTPLPRLVRETPKPHLDVRVPVIADYAILQPVVDRALAKRAARPFVLPKLGSMMVKFGKSTIYGAPGGRIAVGVDVEAKLEMRSGAPTRGRIWMTAIPANEPGSAEVHFTDLSINGDTDGVGGDLLIVLGRSEGLSLIHI